MPFFGLLDFLYFLSGGGINSVTTVSPPLQLMRQWYSHVVLYPVVSRGRSSVAEPQILQGMAISSLIVSFLFLLKVNPNMQNPRAMKNEGL